MAKTRSMKEASDAGNGSRRTPHRREQLAMKPDTWYVAEQFNSTNRTELWQLRDYWKGAVTLDHTFCTPTGAIQHITAEHADRLMAAGKNVYVDIPLDKECPVARYRGSN